MAYSTNHVIKQCIQSLFYFLFFTLKALTNAHHTFHVFLRNYPGSLKELNLNFIISRKIKKHKVRFVITRHTVTLRMFLCCLIDIAIELLKKKKSEAVFWQPQPLENQCFRSTRLIASTTLTSPEHIHDWKKFFVSVTNG